ncbi:MAG: hypothetical protein U0573_02300 [Phycisphaerales bacterium]|nr:hypothetical protein [Planctomycetota bacterium]
MRNLLPVVLIPCATLFSCGKQEAQAPQPPKYVQEQQSRVAAFKAGRGLEEKPIAKLSINDQLASELRRVRAAVSQYAQGTQSFPWRPGQAAGDQWNPLNLAALPANPLSPERAKYRLIEIDRKGVTGSVADPNEAGWVWNSADGKLFAAGSDE